MKKFLLCFGIGFSSLALFGGTVTIFGQNSGSESKTTDIILIVIFALLDFFCIIKLIKDKKKTKELDKKIEKTFQQQTQIAPKTYHNATQSYVNPTTQQISDTRVPSSIRQLQAKGGNFPSYYQREFEILNESYELAFNTKNTETFKSRYELCMETAEMLLNEVKDNTLCGLDYGVVKQYCEKVLADKESLKSHFITNFATSSLDSAKQLKTQKGVISRIQKALDALINEKFLYDASNHKETCKLLQYAIDEIEKTENDALITDLKTEKGTNELIEQPTKVLSDMYSFNGILIKSSVYPPRDNFYVLNNNELIFFDALISQFTENKLNPRNLTMTRMGGNDFEAYYENKNGGCYVGRINLSSETKYAVKTTGSEKVIKNFTSATEVENYIANKDSYFVEEIKQQFTMQYFIGMSKIENITTHDVQDCINTIFRWIRYINYCKKH